MSRRKQARPRSYKLDEVADVNEGQITTADQVGDNHVDVRNGEGNGDISHGGNLMASLLSDGADNNSVNDTVQLSPLSCDHNGPDLDGASHSSGESKPSPQGEDNSPTSGSLPSYLLEDVIENFPYNVGASDEFPYNCYACDKSFLKRGHLQKHEQVHSADWQYSCSYCGKKFRHKRSRDRHSKQHTGHKKYRCIKCDAAFSRSDHLKVHYRTHDQFKPYKCTLCNRSYSTPLSLTIHVSQHNDLKTTRSDTYRCGFCRTTYEQVRELQAHIHYYHKCSDEQDLTPTAASATDDKGDSTAENEDMSVDPADWHECLTCAAMFPTSQQLADHMTNAHPSSNRSSPSLKRETVDDDLNLGRQFVANDVSAVKSETDTDCVIVNEACQENTEGGAKDTLATETLIKDSYLAASLHVCPYCFESSFSTLELLEVHMQSVHSAKPRDIYTCNYCNAPYQNLYSLHEHMRVVHKNKPSFDIKYPCSACGDCYSSLEELAIHKEEAHVAHKSPSQTSLVLKSPTSSMITNPGGKYATVVYRQEAMSPDHAAKRQKLCDVGHTNGSAEPARSDTCFRCNMSFSDSASYVAHMRIHFNEKVKKEEPYSGEHRCSHCGKGFMTHKLLESHTFSHFLVLASKYTCTSCSKSFPKPDELQKHLLDIHAHHLFRCALCKETFDSKVNIQVHFAVKHSNESKSYKCVECCVLFSTEQQFKVHVQTHHCKSDQPQIRCLFCNQSYSNDFDLQCHITTHQKSFRCTMCAEAFHVEFLLDKHIQEVHATAAESKVKAEFSETDPNKEVKRLLTSEYGASRLFDRKFVCNICDETLMDYSSLQQHKLTTHSQLLEHKSPQFDRMHSQPEPTDLSTSAAISDQSTVLDSCPYCSQTFKSRLEMDKHMKIHVNCGSEKCSICDEVFLCASSLAEHKLQHCKISQGNACVECKKSMVSEDDFYAHAQEHGCHGSLMQCIICRQTLASIAELQMHGKYHFQTKAYIYSCCVCMKLFNTTENLITKQSTSSKAYYMCKACFHDDQIEFACPDCPITFPTREQLKTHRLTHRKTYQCIKCQESFNSEYEIKLHVASHMIQEGNMNLCNLCNESFDSPSRLQLHLIQHSFENGQIICHMCGMLFGGAALIQAHAITHGMSGRKHKCSQCSQMFFFTAELRNHVIGEHSAIEKKVDTVAVTKVKPKRSPSSKKSPGTPKIIDDCDVCYKSFATLSALISHKKIHERVDCDDLTCSLCQEVCDSITALQQHTMSMHKASSETIRSDNRMYKCPECHKEFPKLSSLQGHSHIHKTGKRYSCPLCRKVFTLGSNLKLHLQCHTSEKPFTCHICKKTFSRKENMHAHVKSHSGLKPFSCLVCNKNFARNSYLKDHMRIHFAQDPSNPSLSNCYTTTTNDSPTSPKISNNCDDSQHGDATSLILAHNGGPVFPNSDVLLAALNSD